MIRIGRLIMLAGPAAVGKSVALKALTGGKLPTLSAQLGLDGGAPAEYLAGRKVHKIDKLDKDILLFHYDITRPRKYEITEGPYDNEKALRIVAGAERVVFVTCWTDQKILLERLQMKWRFGERLGALIPGSRLARKRRMISLLESIYTDLAKLTELYGQWFEYAGRHTAEAHWIVDTTTRDLTAMTMADWRRRLEERGLKEWVAVCPVGR